jgi:ABC-type glycerol-3-phosphate transport system substrate-binding protein
MKRSVAAFLVLLVLVGMVFAAGQKDAAAPGDRNVSAEVWIHDANTGEWLKKMAERFNATRPDIDFSLDIVIVNIMEIPTKFITSLATGDKSLIPDMVGLAHYTFPRLLKANVQNQIVDLKPHVGDKLKDLATYQMWMFNDKVYGLNWSLSAAVYYYNKDIMDAAGIDPTTFKTYDDFIAAGKKLRQHSNAYMTVLDTAAWNQFQILFLQNEGGLFDKDGNVAMDSKATIDALAMWKRLLDEGVAWPTSEFYGTGPIEAYRKGEVAGVIMADWYGNFQLQSKLPEMSGKWRIAALPAFAPGGKRTSIRGGTGLGIVEQSPYRDILIDFYKFCFTNVDSQVAAFEMLNFFPAYRPALGDARIADLAVPYYGNQKLAKVYADVFSEIPVYYHSPYIPEALDLLNTEVLPGVLRGGLSPEAALKQAAQKLRQAMRN